MTGRYILDDAGEPVPCPDLLAWATWFEKDDHRIVAQDIVAGFKVSTVFLGVDHNFRGRGQPVLWETMVFGPDDLSAFDDYETRYTSRAAALRGHADAVAMVLRARADKP